MFTRKVANVVAMLISLDPKNANKYLRLGEKLDASIQASKSSRTERKPRKSKRPARKAVRRSSSKSKDAPLA